MAEEKPLTEARQGKRSWGTAPCLNVPAQCLKKRFPLNEASKGGMAGAGQHSRVKGGFRGHAQAGIRRSHASASAPPRASTVVSVSHGPYAPFFQRVAKGVPSTTRQG